MIKEIKTIKDATEYWVRGFNAIEYTMIERIITANSDDLTELTPICNGDYVFDNETGDRGEVKSINYEDETAVLNDKEVDLRDLYIEDRDSLPMWGTLWTFEEGFDTEWCRDNLETVANCGFRIYEYEPTGDIIIGIDGAGYDFYEAHWIPLYKARGLKWHDEEEKVD